jgi:hypothetical protein
MITQTLFPFITKQATLIRRSTILSLPLQLVFPDETLALNECLQMFTIKVVKLLALVSMTSDFFFI